MASEKDRFELLIIGEMLSPEQALQKLGYELKTPYENLCNGIKILNDGWIPNWLDEYQMKYWIWWNMNGEFTYYSCNFRIQASAVPSALCIKDEETIQLAIMLIKDLFKKVYL